MIREMTGAEHKFDKRHKLKKKKVVIYLFFIALSHGIEMKSLELISSFNYELLSIYELINIFILIYKLLYSSPQSYNK